MSPASTKDASSKRIATQDNGLKRSNAIRGEPARRSTTQTLGNSISSRREVSPPECDIVLAEKLLFDEPEQEDTPSATTGSTVPSISSEGSGCETDFSWLPEPAIVSYPEVVDYVDLTTTVQAKEVWVKSSPPLAATTTAAANAAKTTATSAGNQPSDDVTHEFPSLLQLWARDGLTACEIGERLHEFAYRRDAFLGNRVTDMVDAGKAYHEIGHHIIWELNLRRADSESLCSAVPVGDVTRKAVPGPRAPRDYGTVDKDLLDAHLRAAAAASAQPDPVAPRINWPFFHTDEGVDEFLKNEVEVDPHRRFSVDEDEQVVSARRMLAGLSTMPSAQQKLAVPQARKPVPGRAQQRIDLRAVPARKPVPTKVSSSIPQPRKL